MTVTIEDFCREVRNYFPRDILFGEFTVKDGKLVVDDLQEGQYFRIVGSVFNDGVYIYPAENLTDESFDGAIWAMAVPRAVVAFLSEINDYQASLDAKKDIVNSPFQSESFGGYSYSKSSGNNSNSGSGNVDPYSWQERFKNRLNVWRKVRAI